MSTTTPTAEQFLDMVVRSGLLSHEVLRPYAQRTTASPEAHQLLANLLVKDRLLTPFQARQILAGKHRGFFLADKYKILSFIGTGGTGHVFLCEHLLLQRLVAVKLLQNSAAEMTRGGQAAALERFVREARAVAALDHMNIVRVHDMERAGATPFMVMEYVDGTSLHQVVAKFGRLSVQRAAHYVSQAATGLQHAHEHGLIHRDIKPGNLLLERSGLVKILDLGLARFLRDTSRNEDLTGRYKDDDAIVGTVDYMSPEQAMNNPQIDIRSDIYSLGATFYFLLTGQAPFEKETVAQKLVAHQLREPPAIDSLHPDVPRQLYAVLLKMMAKKPDARFQTPADVATALTPWTRTRAPIPAPPATEMPKLPISSYRLGLAPPPGSVAEDSPGRWDFPLAPDAAQDGLETPAIGDQGTSRPATSQSRKYSTPVPGALTPEADLPEPVAPPPLPTEPVPSGVRRSVLLESAEEAEAPETTVETGRQAPAKPSSTRSLLIGIVAVIGILAAAGIFWMNYQKTQKEHSEPIKPGQEGPPQPPISAVVIKGSGSTFIKPAMDHWLSLYAKQTGTKIEYSGIGSGRGVENMVDKVLDFGCTDAFMSDSQLTKARAANGDVIHIPLAMGAVVVIYTLPEVKEQLKFTGPVLADIYLGKITKWNHQAIELCNPGVKLPDLDITVIRRQDSSGTTHIWTDYLNKASPVEWKNVGVGNTVKWPVGVDADKSGGMVDAVLGKHGAIGYVELSFALERNLKFAQVKNKNGRYVEPTLESVTAAANASLQDLPPDLRYTLTNAPGDDSYPIAGTTWAVVYTKQTGARGRELVKFLRWATHDGQAHLKGLRYAALPPNLVSRIDELLAKIQVTE